jgi:hypothetical protein
MTVIDNTKYGGFIVSQNILSGHPVGFTFREQSNFSQMNGWTLYSVDDDDEYANQSDNFVIVSAETIARISPVVIELFYAPYGTDLTWLYEDGVHIGFWDNNDQREVTIAEILKPTSSDWTMTATFEDAFSALQKDMVQIAYAYVEDRADKIFVWASSEEGFSYDVFFMVHGKVVEKHKLNDVLWPEEPEYDVSRDRQRAMLRVGMEDVKKLQAVCQRYDRPMPTELRLTYDVTARRLSADYSYELLYTNSRTLTGDDIFQRWFDQEATAAS